MTNEELKELKEKREKIEKITNSYIEFFINEQQKIYDILMKIGNKVNNSARELSEIIGEQQ